MLKWLQNMSFRASMAILTLFTTFLALFLFSLIFITYDVLSLKEAIIERSFLFSEMVASSNAAAILFDDKEDATENLELLREVPQIDYAAIFDEDNKLFTDYSRNTQISSLDEIPRGKHFEFSLNSVRVFAPIIVGEKRVGTVFIERNLKDFFERLYFYFVLLGIAFALALGLSLIVAWRLQGTLTRPIVELMQAAKTITVDKNYAIRAQKIGDNELGVMTDAFNSMLEEIEAQDVMLQNERSQLEETVKKRTLELRHSLGRIEETNTRLRDANRTKNLFLGSMSHEIRTPINAILGFSRLMKRSELENEEHREHVNTIIRSGEHLLTMFNDMLDMSKIEANRITLTENDFNLHNLIEDLESVFSLKAQSKGIKLKVQVTGVVAPGVFADEAKLRQVLVNLIGNAIKFTKQGEVEVRFDYQVINEWRGVLDVKVIDSGCGIEADEIEKVFLPFTQTKSGLNAQEGTGLGLAISKRFVELLGGNLRVISEVNKGSVFSFTIPVSVVQDVDRRVEQSNFSILKLVEDSGHPLILVVDDDAVNRDLLKQLLTKIGFQVAVAEDGLEAISVFEKMKPALILMDMRMPNMDGYEATRMIKKSARGNGNPVAVIALTASAFEENRAHVLEAGCDEFIRKPFVENHLLETMRTFLEIDYVYANEADDNSLDKEHYDMEAITQRARELPGELIEQFQEAIINGDYSSLERLCGTVAKTDEELSQILHNHVKHFNYSTLGGIFDSNAQT